MCVLLWSLVRVSMSANARRSVRDSSENYLLRRQAPSHQGPAVDYDDVDDSELSLSRAQTSGDLVVVPVDVTVSVDKFSRF